MPLFSAVRDLEEFSKAGFYINYNPHKSNYETVEQYFSDPRFDGEDILDIGQEVINKMDELDKVYEVISYKNTPVGSYQAYHYNLEEAIRIVLEDS